jgi:hypothetical protein
MSTYKKLNKQDAFITTYTAYKHWAVSGSQFVDYGIQVIPQATGVYSSSLAQLYYPPKISGSIVTHSFDNYTDTTLNLPELRNFNPNSFIISIPRSMTGVHIRPGAQLGFTITDVQVNRYVSASYWANDNYTNDPTTYTTVNVLTLYDDGEGGLYTSGSNPRDYIGDIVYPHGMIILTDDKYLTLLRNMWVPDLPQSQDPDTGIFFPKPAPNTKNRNNLKLSWQSSQPIFTHNYHCRIRESEYNFTYNPTALSSSLETVYNSNQDIYSTSGSISKGDLNNKITGSAFQPYITTVGLYNDANQLIAVGKMSQPVPKPANTEMTIIVKIDI